MVCAALHEAALTDLSAREEQAVYVAVAAIHVVYLLRHLAAPPCVSVVLAIVAAHLQRLAVVARRAHPRPSVAHLARTGHYQHTSRPAVAHHSRVAMALVEVAAAEAPHGAFGGAPCAPAILAPAHLYTDVACRPHVAPTRSVRHTRTVVREGYHLLVVSHDRRNAIILMPRRVRLP